MVKSNGYGHGLVEVAHALPHADAFGVARLKEALQLRAGGVVQPIVLMPGFLEADQLPIIGANSFQVVLHQPYQLDMLENITLSKPIDVWLKIDTGMGRLGFTVDEAVIALKRLQQNKNVDELRFMTHFACVDEPSHPTNELQLERLDQALKILPGEWSCAKSGAILGYPQTHHEWVRPGLMLYGVSPLTHKTTSQVNLKPVMTLLAPIISIRELAKGEPVGYGSTFICPENMRVGVIGVGYGDGYPRQTKAGTPVLVDGKPAPRIGRVCMDMMMIDLRDHPDVKVGEPAVLWGSGLPAEDVAKNADTIAYDLFCSVTKRVKFEYLN